MAISQPGFHHATIGVSIKQTPPNRHLDQAVLLKSQQDDVYIQSPVD